MYTYNQQISIFSYCELSNISRSGQYYFPKCKFSLNLSLIAGIDLIFLEYFFRISKIVGLISTILLAAILGENHVG